ncbi:hypothetical protein [Vagococcus hydrophili]|uniref:Lipoprotein n=1 Tax=Vagococcus hydrophili TaxID=2714947 RepID=A0A6G8AWR9_9ENTE|nr:hypothetical protein [Vagococcus hydrophili]QIL49395.1 hypothetical protein G7082_13245 [Vagococcus hydrophili]
MKKVMLLSSLLLLFAGCQNNTLDNNKDSSVSSENSVKATSESTDSKKTWLSINGATPKYLERNKIELTGKGKPNTKLVISLEKDQSNVATTEINSQGDFTVRFNAPESKESYLFENQDKKTFIYLYSESNFAKKDEIANKEKEDKEKAEKDKQEAEELKKKKIVEENRIKNEKETARLEEIKKKEEEKRQEEKQKQDMLNNASREQKNALRLYKLYSLLQI